MNHIDSILIEINKQVCEKPTYSILETKEAVEEYNRINRTSNKLGDTVVTYKISKFEPVEFKG